MTTTDYLFNLLFVFVVFRQAHEREIDRRYFVIPVVLVIWVASSTCTRCRLPATTCSWSPGWHS
jgi:hypothetical protein